jgi:lysyl-tRNA synthetase class 2
VPSEFYGIKDEEERYRKRYLDILLDRKARDIVYKRARFWQTIRGFLIERGFIEVETPVLENTPGGADARPFVTHHHALDIDMYLRISAGELWQKKLMVAGLPKTFEIGRIFRNEGMSAEHLQDYTQLEFYEAYADYEKGMELVKELYLAVASEVFGTTAFAINGHEVDLSGTWQRYDYVALIREHYGVDAISARIEDVEAALRDAQVPFERKELNVERGLDMLWKKLRKDIAGPGFLINVPVALEPLAKRSAENSSVVERFQILIAGSEVGKGFSELNDPVDQKERFARQQALRDAGDEEAQMADLDYVEALEYGMPPTFGFGVSERLFAFLMGESVRETQLFPLMRPKE